MNRERRTDDGTYPNVEEERAKIAERASASRIEPIVVTASDALDTLGELSDGYGPEAHCCFEVMKELLTAAEELVKEATVYDHLPEFRRLQTALKGKPLP